MESIDAVATQTQDSDLIELVIGKDITRPTYSYRISLSILESHSKYFTAALKKGSFAEGQNRRIVFQEDEVEPWKILNYWIHKRELPDDLHVGGGKDMNLTLAKAWEMGNRYFMPDFQDGVMCVLLRRAESKDVEERFDMPLIRSMLAVAPPDSRLLKLLIEEAVFLEQGVRTHEDDGISYNMWLLRGMGVWSQKRSRASWPASSALARDSGEMTPYGGSLS